MSISGINHRIGFDRFEPLLMPQRVSTIHSISPPGRDITLVCTTKQGGLFYCKDDKPNRYIRATEMLLTRIAGLVNIATPFCSVIDRHDGSTLFGSLGNGSTADELEVRDYLSREEAYEFGGPSPWLGRKLAAIYVFDLFWGNRDRSLRNFILEHDTRRLCAYDFADVQLANLSHHRFPVETDNTIFVGRYLRQVHGFELAYAYEMLDHLHAIPAEVVQTILSEMPYEWLPNDQREWLCDVWNKQRSTRLYSLRSGLKDGSLL